MEQQLTPDNHFYIRFKHGLGDACQFNIILKFVKQKYPNHKITLETLPGREGIFSHLVDYFADARVPWDRSRKNATLKYIIFPHSPKGYYPQPCTKTSWCLEKDFGFDVNKLFHNDFQTQIWTDYDSMNMCKNWTQMLPQGPMVLLHNQGLSRPDAKVLDDKAFGKIVEKLLQYKLVPVIFDWSGKNKYVDNKNVFSPLPLPQNSKTIHSLLGLAKLFIGIDSGPAHVAAATHCPSMVLWTHHFPPYNFDYCSNVVHLMCDDCLKEDEFPGMIRFPEAEQGLMELYHHQWIGNKARMDRYMCWLLDKMFKTDNNVIDFWDMNSRLASTRPGPTNECWENLDNLWL